MSPDDGFSWQEGLSRVRGRVLKMEKRRETEHKLQRERNAESLQKQLHTDTVESIKARCNDIRQHFDRAVRKFCPLREIEATLKELDEFHGLLEFYSGCMKDFAKVFTPAHKTVIPKLMRELTELRKSVERQLGSWSEASECAESVSFVPRTNEHNDALVTVAKSFSERAHKIPLSIPSDFFAHENKDFWVVTSAEDVLGYMKFFAEDKVLGFALAPVVKVNFNRFMRVILHKFITAGPVPEKMDAVRVRITYQREVKFFTDLGFVRLEVKGPSNWIYQREIG